MVKRPSPVCRFVGCFVVVLFFLTACSPGAPATSTAGSAAPAASTAVSAAPPAAKAPASPASSSSNVVPATASIAGSFSFLHFFAGVEKGIWLKHGIDLKLRIFTSGPDMAKALAAGDAQFSVQAFSNFPAAIDQGLPFVGVANALGDSTRATSDRNLLITARDASGIKTVQDLAGKKVGLITNGTPDLYLREVLAKNNIPADKVEFTNVPAANTVTAMQAGQVDAVVTIEPEGSRVLAEVPNTHLVLQGGNYVAYFSLLVVTRDQLAKDPAFVQNAVNGLAESSWWVRQNPDEAAEIATRWIPGLSSAVAKKSTVNVDFDARVSKLMLGSLREESVKLINQKKIKQMVNPEEVTDLRFIQQTVKQHPEWFSDLKPID